MGVPEIPVTPSESNPLVRCVRLSGRLDTLTVGSIGPVIFQTIEESPSGVILDLGDVSFVSSAGLRLLVDAFKSAVSSGKKMAMTRLQPEVYKIFKMAGLDPLLAVFNDETQALNEIWKKES